MRKGLPEDSDRRAYVDQCYYQVLDANGERIEIVYLQASLKE